MSAEPKVLRSLNTHRVAVLTSVLFLLWLPRLSSAQAGLWADKPAGAAVRIGVLGLFRPQEFVIAAAPRKALVVHGGSESIVLEKTSGFGSAKVKLAETKIIATAANRALTASTIVVTGRGGEPTEFTLMIPGKITRRYQGILEIQPSTHGLVAIVSMDLETAVASIVAAENPSGTSLEALKAQAVATRSYLLSGRGRHADFDFCDTTHCQFLREPPSPDSPSAHAASTTRGLILAYNDHPFSAMYTRSCSGHTRTPAQIGLTGGSYPYYSVDCKFCLSHPDRWTTHLASHDAAALRNSDEAARLNIDRRLGWSTVPSNDFVSWQQGDETILQGTGQGHGIGLCQQGANAMAHEGASYQQILTHYYPNTKVTNRSGSTSSGGLVRPAK
jgi:stage II sporulation protein D